MPHYKDNYPLHYVIRAGDLNAFSSQLDAMEAYSTSYAPRVDALLRLRDDEDHTVLYYAVACHEISMVRRLTKAEITVAKASNSPAKAVTALKTRLQYMVRLGNTDDVKSAIVETASQYDAFIDPNAPAPYTCRTELHDAAIGANPSQVVYLTRLGVDVNVRSRGLAEKMTVGGVEEVVDGLTPLHCIAAALGTLKPNRANPFNTSEELAIIRLALQALSDAGADVNARSTFGGYTPIHLALSSFKGSNAYKASVEALLQAGADPNIRTDNGHTALDIALVKCRCLVELLKTYGAVESDSTTPRVSRLSGVKQWVGNRMAVTNRLQEAASIPLLFTTAAAGSLVPSQRPLIRRMYGATTKLGGAICSIGEAVLGEGPLFVSPCPSLENEPYESTLAEFFRDDDPSHGVFLLGDLRRFSRPVKFTSNDNCYVSD